MRARLVLFLLVFWLAPRGWAERYALILTDAPAMGGAPTRIMAAQTTLRRELAQRSISVTRLGA